MQFTYENVDCIFCFRYSEDIIEKNAGSKFYKGLQEERVTVV